MEASCDEHGHLSALFPHRLQGVVDERLVALYGDGIEVLQFRHTLLDRLRRRIYLISKSESAGHLLHEVGEGLVREFFLALFVIIEIAVQKPYVDQAEEYLDVAV